LLLLLERSFLERLIAFDKKNDRYREFLEYAQKKINKILVQKIHYLFGVSITHMYGVFLRIHPNILQARENRDIYSFVLRQESPEYWIEKMREQSAIKVEFDFNHQKGRAEKPFVDGRIKFTLGNFSELYESVQTCVLKDSELSEFFELKKEVIKEANDLIEEIESLIREKR